ncbi:MAG: ASCH domain-containing protein [Lactobacillus kalixensis]|uniref:ASCH domain-containing protein n=1 Tax=Lactobacillus kalixensis TaxID=227944 RepID=UPI00399668C9
MKALSVRGDYIMDMIRGTKTIEYRSWQTNYRGPVLMCSTVKKVQGACPGYAMCVAKITNIEWSEKDRLYHWHIAPFERGGSYLVKPFHVKGQLRLFNVDDKLIHHAPYYPSNTDVRFINWWRKNVYPLIVK